MANTKRILIFILLSALPLTSYAQFVLCSTLNRDHIEVSYEANAVNEFGSFLTLRPKLPDVPLETHAVDDSLVTVRYNACYEVFNISELDGVQAFLPDSGETYDGRSNYHHQVIFGGKGNDVIHTGDGIDYVYGNGGDDMLFTYADYDRIFGGEGIDCGEKGADSSLGVTNMDYVEFDSCANFVPREDALPSLNAACTIQDDSFDAYIFGNTWVLYTDSTGVSISVEQQGGYLFAYSDGHRHCEIIENTVAGMEVFLSDGNDTFNSANVHILTNVYGYRGNDTIVTGNSHDLIFGGGGNDNITANGGNDWIIGDSEIETDRNGVVHTAHYGVTTDDGADTINGGDGIDVIFGNGGGDNISGGNDADVIFGNGGNNDNLSGSEGEDLIVASANSGTGWDNRARVSGGSGQDILLCEEGPCSLKGGGSADLLMQLAQSGDIGLYGGNGGDTMYIRADSYPVGKGGKGNDGCYAPQYSKLCQYYSEAWEDYGSLREPIRRAADRMNAVHEEYLHLKSRVSHNTTHSELKKIFADVVRRDVFDSWLNNRQLNVYQLQ